MGGQPPLSGIIPEKAHSVILSAAKKHDCYAYLCHQALVPRSWGTSKGLIPGRR